MKKLFRLIVVGSLLVSCNEEVSQEKEAGYELPVNLAVLPAQLIDTIDLRIDKSLSHQILFQEGDLVRNLEGELVPSKSSHDATVYIQEEDNDSILTGTLFVSHETSKAYKGLPNGGGSTLLKLMKDSTGWRVLDEKAVTNYTTVGGTANNCGATLTPWNTIVTAEEIFPLSNDEIPTLLTPQASETAYLNYGHLVEVDPSSNKAIGKLKHMGRFVHEHAYFDHDNKTVYLTNDDSPAVFFKYEYKEDLSQGQLYAMKEDSGKVSWIELPSEESIRIDARAAAIKQGASLFIRHEWMTKLGNKIYITETGADSLDMSEFVDMGGKVASYFQKEGNVVDDPFGRILVYDLDQQTIVPFLNGGKLSFNEHFSNPDCITKLEAGKSQYLLVCEDIIGKNRGRSNDPDELFNDLFLIQVPDGPGNIFVKRILTAARGAEPTGLTFTPNGKNLFLNVQHPDTTNQTMKRSTTLVLEGF